MEDEGQIGRRVIEVVDKVGIHLQRVSPAKSGEDANGEVGGEHFARTWIVMTDCCYTAKEIAEGSPP